MERKKSGRRKSDNQEQRCGVFICLKRRGSGRGEGDNSEQGVCNLSE
jgi:hypothetical protein